MPKVDVLKPLIERQLLYPIWDEEAQYLHRSRHLYVPMTVDQRHKTLDIQQSSSSLSVKG